MALTFFGAYRGPSWKTTGSHAAVQEAAAHGVKHPADPGAHGKAHLDDHEVTHGPADSVPEVHVVAHDDHVHAHGHGVWHGPHESPRPMTLPLMALAVGAIVAGFVGIPSALGGTNEVEHFLEPSFTASHAAASTEHAATAPAGAEPSAAETTAAAAQPAGAAHEAAGTHASRRVELGLMIFSVLVAVVGIWLASTFYIKQPDIPARLAEQYAGVYRLLYNKYYVDELYGATVIAGTMASARGLWTFDSRVVDGVVNGTGWFTVLASWISHIVDKYVVDGFVNLIAWVASEGSLLFRRLQTGLIQNYALLMLLGVFAFISLYLLAQSSWFHVNLQ
jgi:NADH-quinone oxidoreductase subunit L